MSSLSLSSLLAVISFFFFSLRDDDFVCFFFFFLRFFLSSVASFVDRMSSVVLADDFSLSGLESSSFVE